MRLWTLLLVLFILAGLVIAQEEASEEVGMTYKDIRLDDAIRLLAKDAKINLVLPFELEKKITLQTEEAVDPLKLLQIVVATHGYELIKNENVYTVQAKETKKKEVSTTDGTVGTTTSTGIDTVAEENPITVATFQLIQTPVEQAESKVRGMLSLQGKLEVNREGNALYVVDNASNVNQIKGYVDFLNTDPNAAFNARMEQRTFKINRMSAESVDEVAKKMVSDKGKYAFDKTSMTLTVMERKETLDNIDQFIRTADQAEPQLYIRCHFVEVNVTAGSKLATQFEDTSIKMDDVDTGTGFNLMPKTLGDLTQSDVALFSFASSKNDISGLISAQANRNNYRLLSSPNLLCYNRQLSKISITSELAYVQTTTDTNSTPPTKTQTVEFKEVGIVMEVTPEIYSDGTVKLNLKPSVSEKYDDISIDEGLVPVIRKKAVESNVMAKDGQVIVIGGLLEDQIRKSRYKVPLLGDIPLIGFLFSREQQDMVKTELVIFLHITLMNEASLKNMADQKWREQEEKFQKFDTEFEFYPHLKEKLDMQKLNPNFGQADMKASTKAKVADGFEFVPHK